MLNLPQTEPMQIKPTIFLQILTVCCLCFNSCTKKNSPSPTPETKPSPGKEDPVLPPPTAEKSHIPETLTSESLTITLKYTATSGNLSEIESSDGTKELYFYNDKGQLKEYDRYEKSERKYVVYYIRDQDGQVIKGNQNEVESEGTVLTPNGYYRIEYTVDKKISKISWFDNGNRLLREEKRTYNEDGSVQVSTTAQNAGTLTYTFDGENAWCSRVNYTQVLSIESLPGLFLSSTENISKATSTTLSIPSTSYTYTYDTDNFPTSWVETDVKTGTKRSLKVTYK